MFNKKIFLIFLLIFSLVIFPSVIANEFSIKRDISKSFFNELGEEATIVTSVKNIGNTSSTLLYREKLDESINTFNDVIFNLNNIQEVMEGESYNLFIFYENLTLNPGEIFSVEYNIRITNPQTNQITFGEVELIEITNNEVITYKYPEEKIPYYGIIIKEDKNDELNNIDERPLSVFGLTISQETSINLKRIIISIIFGLVVFIVIRFVILRKKKYEIRDRDINLEVFSIPRYGDYNGLKTYIQRQRQNSMHNFEIKKKLIDNGWPEEVINSMLK